MRLIKGRPVMYLNPAETEEVLRRYTSIGRLLQAATEMEYLTYCWLEALIGEQNDIDWLYTNRMGLERLRRELLKKLKRAGENISGKDRLLSSLEAVSALMKVRNIVCHNAMLMGESGEPQTRTSIKDQSLIVDQARIDAAALGFRSICNALYESYRDTFHYAPRTRDPRKWIGLSDDPT